MVLTFFEELLCVREFQKNLYFCFIDYAKAFDCVDHNKLWEILKGLVGLHRTVQLQLLQHYWLGHTLG